MIPNVFTELNEYFFKKDINVAQFTSKTTLPERRYKDIAMGRSNNITPLSRQELMLICVGLQIDYARAIGLLTLAGYTFFPFLQEHIIEHQLLYKYCKCKKPNPENGIDELNKLYKRM